MALSPVSGAERHEMQEHAQYSSRAEFGPNNQYQIGVRVTQCEGPFQDSKKAATHIGLIVDTATKLETITLVTDERWGDSGKTNETIQASFQSGGVKLGLEIEFKFSDRQIPRDALEAIVDGNIMPAALQTVGYYRSDRQLVAMPSTSFAAVTPRSSSLLGRLDEVIADNDAARQGRQQRALR